MMPNWYVDVQKNIKFFVLKINMLTVGCRDEDYIGFIPQVFCLIER